MRDAHVHLEFETNKGDLHAITKKTQLQTAVGAGRDVIVVGNDQHRSVGSLSEVWCAHAFVRNADI